MVDASWEGRTIDGKYVVEGVLGRGGMGTVLRARHSFTGQLVAVKVLRERIDAGSTSRFHAEARAPSSIGHPAICPVLDAGVTVNGEPYMVMELLQGETVGARVARGAVPLAEAVRIGGEALDALAAAHAAGFVHRDIKPDNVFLAGPAATVRLLDFGIAKVMDAGPTSQPTATGALMGTLAYMSPEQLKNSRKVDLRTDLWAMGVVLYEMLVARQPFQAEGFGELLIQMISMPDAPFESAAGCFAPRTEAFLRRALAIEVADRFASAAEMAAALRALSDPGSAQLPVAATSPARPAAAASPRRGALPWALGGVGVLVSAVAVVGGLFAAGVIELEQDGAAPPPRASSAPPPSTAGGPIAASQLQGQWAIAEGRTPTNRSYSGEVSISQSGPAFIVRWAVTQVELNDTMIEGRGILDGNHVFVGWGSVPFGVFVYRVAGGRLEGRSSASDDMASLQTETLDGPPSLGGTFRIVASSTGRTGTLTLAKDGARFLATRTTNGGQFRGVGLLEGSTLAVVVGDGDEPAGLYAFRVESGGKALTGRWTDTTEPGLGREILAIRSASLRGGM